MCLYVGIYMCLQFLHRPEEGVDSPGTKVARYVSCTHAPWRAAPAVHPKSSLRPRFVLFLKCTYLCVGVCSWVQGSSEARGIRVPQELELKVVVDHLMLVLGRHLGFLQKQQLLLNAEPSLKPNIINILCSNSISLLGLGFLFVYLFDFLIKSPIL